jgi:hypothetical protein
MALERCGSGSIVKTLAVGAEDHETSAAPASATPVAPQPTIPLQRRNRSLGLALASIAAAVFVTVIALVVLFHYAEVHHVLSRV